MKDLRELTIEVSTWWLKKCNLAEKMVYTAILATFTFIFFLYFQNFLSNFKDEFLMLTGNYIFILLGTSFFTFIGTVAAKEYMKARDQAIKDPLTGAYNRNFMIDSLEKKKARIVRRGGKLFMIFIDCDDFKKINELYSHAGGDLVLSKIAKAINSTLRTEDILVRFGGDEFLIFIESENHGEEIEVSNAIERIRKKVRNLRVVYKQHNIIPSVSLAHQEIDPEIEIDSNDYDMYFRNLIENLSENMKVEKEKKDKYKADG